MKNLVHNNNLYVISRTNIHLPITVYVMSYNPCWKCCINQHEFHFGQLVYAESIFTVSSQAILNLCWGPACKTYTLFYWLTILDFSLWVAMFWLFFNCWLNLLNICTMQCLKMSFWRSIFANISVFAVLPKTTGCPCMFLACWHLQLQW